MLTVKTLVMVAHVLHTKDVAGVYCSNLGFVLNSNKSTAPGVVDIFDLILKIVIGLIPLFIWWKQRPPCKELSYEFFADPQLPESKGDQGLQILFDGKSVEDARLVIVRLHNSGRVNLSMQDIEAGNVSLCFGEKSKILAVDVSKSNPKITKPSVLCVNNQIKLMPIHLFKNDFIEFRILLSQYDDFSVDGIIDNKDIKPFEKPDRKVVFVYIGIFLTCFSLLLSYLQNKSLLPFDFLSYFLILGYASIILGILKFRYTQLRIQFSSAWREHFN